jgi:diaminopimelate decarboxylase
VDKRRLPLSHWGFHDRRRGLQLGRLGIRQLAERVGTPFYLFDEERLRNNIREAATTAARILPKAELLFSMKTNPHRGVLDVVREEGLGAEAISSREVESALEAGITPSKIVMNGPGKADEDLLLAIRKGILVQVESASEARAVARLARLEKRKARVGIRVNPDVVEERAPCGVRMGERCSVFGMSPDGAEFNAAVSVLHGAPELEIRSLSAHIGTGIVSSEPFGRLSRKMTAVREDLASRGLRIPCLDLGGGFPVISECRYADGGFEELSVGARRTVPPAAEIVSFKQICETIARELEKAPPVSCVLEPGRLLVSDAFHLVTKVVRTKREGGKKFAIVDASRVQNALFVGRGYHEIVHIENASAAAEGRYTITGPLCADFDVFYADLPMPRLSEGDLLAVLDVGAYNLSAQCHWSFEPAPVVRVGNHDPD